MSQPNPTQQTGNPPAGAAGDPNPPQPDPAPAQNQPPAAATRPDGITDEVWNALGDPGRNALVQEREARQAAERALAASRARPAPPKATPPTGQQPPAAAQPPAAQPDAGNGPDLAKLVQDAVTAAIKPFQDAETARQHEAAASKISDAVLAAAKGRLVDPTDALTGIDLTQVTDGTGGADAAKITAQLDDLLKRKPHLGLGPRAAQPGFGSTPPPSGTTDDQVKTILARMQASAGVRTTPGT